MARRANGPVWYDSKHKANPDHGWFININGQRINCYTTDKEEADILYHELMGESKKRPAEVIKDKRAPKTVRVLIDRFLDWVKRNRADDTYRNYLYILNDQFLAQNKLLGSTLTDNLKGSDVREWAESQDDWGNTYKADAISAVQRVYRWGVKYEEITLNPIQYIPKPEKDDRDIDAYVEKEDFVRMRDSLPLGDDFRDYIEFLWETGCRPQEIRQIEVKHVNMDMGYVRMPNVKDKGPKWRFIVLNDAAKKIIKRQHRKDGFVFLNSRGRPWKKAAVSMRFQAISKRLGMPKRHAYELRHGALTEMLVHGTDSLKVATISGHTSVETLHKVYSHIIKHPEVLIDELEKRDEPKKKAKRKPR